MLRIRQSCAHLDEAGLQKLVVSLLRDLQVFFFHVPNAGKRSFASANFMRQLGMTAGVPDLIIVSRTAYMRENSIPGVAIELKRKPNKPTLKQRNVIDAFLYNNWAATVCYTFDEVVIFLNKCGYPVALGPETPPA